jgi:hypothetical protein
MPCDHKFQNELNLGLIDYEPTTLIVEPFNPELGASNSATWFYGRTEENCFWDVVPRIYGEASLIKATANEWKQFCRNKQIAITSLISSIDDAEPGNPGHARILEGFSDKAIAYHFDDFSFVGIAQILQQRPSIRNVYLTRGVTEAFWRHLWNPVMQYCSRNNLHERKLVPPTAESAYQHMGYNEQHPGTQIQLFEDYILMRWREEWHF